jgi:hypothetical protein
MLFVADDGRREVVEAAHVRDLARLWMGHDEAVDDPRPWQEAVPEFVLAEFGIELEPE